MPSQPLEAVQPPARVALVDGCVLIRDLSVDGTLAALAGQALAEGRDIEVLVRQALEVGAAVLLHGSAKGTVDAVAAEVDRVLVVLQERSARIEAVRRQGERVAAKGFTFEDELAPVLDACFASHEDIFEVTGAERGIADDKVGDFVVTLNPRDTGGRVCRIVFEAKNRAVTMRKALDELDAAMLNRDADVGVMVFARSAQAPLAGKPLRVFPGNRLMVVWDAEQDGAGDLALEICAQLARTLAAVADSEVLKLDRGLLSEKLAALTNVIDRGSDIDRGVRTARRGLDAVVQAYGTMRTEALALLLELEERLQGP